MIAIKVNGSFLDLDPSTRIRYRRNSDFFNTDVIQGDYTFPFDIPVTDHNRKLLDYPDQMANESLSNERISAEVYFQGVLLYPGTIKIISIADDKIRISFTSGLSKLAQGIKNKKLADFFVGDTVTNTATETVYYWIVTIDKEDIKTYPDAALSLEIGPTLGRMWIAVNKGEETHTDIVAAENQLFGVDFKTKIYYAGDFEGDTLKDNPYSSDPINVDALKSLDAAFVIQLYDVSVLPTVTIYARQTDQDSAPLLTYDYIKTSINFFDYSDVMNNFFLDRKIDFPQVRFGNAFSGVKGHSNIINHQYQNKLRPFNTPAKVDLNKLEYVWQFNLVPFISLSYILRTIFDAIGILYDDVYFDRDGLSTNDDFKFIQVMGSKTIDQYVPVTMYDSSDVIIVGATYYVNKTIDSFDLNEVMPDILVTDFLKGIRNIFGLYFHYDEINNKISIDTLSSLLSDTFDQDITYKVLSKAVFYPNTYDGITFDIQNCQLKPFILGNGKHLISSKVGMVLDDINEQINYNLTESFTVNAQINSLVKSSQASAPCLLTQYRAQENDADKIKYPYKSSTSRYASIFSDQYSSSIFNSFDYFFEKADINNEFNGNPPYSSPKSLKTLFWDPVINFFKNTRRASVHMNLSLLDVLTMNVLKKKMFNHNTYLIKSIDVTLTMDGVEAPKVEMYKA